MSAVPTVVIGAAGFVGRALVRRLRDNGRNVIEVNRGDPLPRVAGDVYQCAGLTADFRARPYDTVVAHVSLVNELLSRCDFSSLTYLSSTRVYQKVSSGREDASLSVDPNDPSDLYNLSKLTGEAACLTDSRETVRVARLSNVFGPNGGSANFLDSVLLEAQRDGRAIIRSGAAAAKDYVALSDVIAALVRFPSHAKSRLINVASGVNTTNAQIATLIEGALGTPVTFASDDPGTRFPIIEIARMTSELGIAPRPFQTAFTEWINS